MKRILVVSGMALALSAQLLTSQAFAQDEPPPPPPPPGEEAAPPPPPPPGKGPPDKPRGPEKGGPDRGGPDAKGFKLDYGMGVGLRVNCGNEPLKACIEAAKPLIDKLPAYDPAAMKPVPPRDHD